MFLGKDFFPLGKADAYACTHTLKRRRPSAPLERCIRVYTAFFSMRLRFEITCTKVRTSIFSPIKTVKREKRNKIFYGLKTCNVKIDESVNQSNR